MAAQFIGLTVLLTLNDPGRSRLRGLVAGVNGPELTLRDGEEPPLLKYPPSYADQISPSPFCGCQFWDGELYRQRFEHRRH